jgi:hypothetical protein
MNKLLTVVVCLLVAAPPADANSDKCRAGAPDVNKLGFRPNATVPYDMVASPSGRPFPIEMIPCVWRAFHAWTKANVATSLGVKFVPGSGGIVVRYADAEESLPQFVAGGWTHPVRAEDGALLQATVWLSSDRRVLSNCDGVTKTVLHELGHLHGLADHRGPAGTTVMNSLDRKNDSGKRLPMMPTVCDAQQAVLASAALSDEPTADELPRLQGRLAGRTLPSFTPERR